MTAFGERFLPPLPGEHGAIVMTAAALVTPLAVVVSTGLPDTGQLAAYTAFVGLVAVALLLREALQRRHGTSDPADRRRLTAFATGEGLAVVALSGLLGLLYSPVWVLGVLLVGFVEADLRLRRRGWPVPFGGELSGVVAISLAVPAAATLLEVGGPWSIGGLWLLFLAFHVGSVLRVGMMLPSSSGVASRYLLAVGLGYHAGLVVLAAVAWLAGWVGPAAPFVFAAAAFRAGQALRLGDEPIALKSLGRAEGALSLLFVLTAPWLFP